MREREIYIYICTYIRANSFGAPVISCYPVSLYHFGFSYFKAALPSSCWRTSVQGSVFGLGYSSFTLIPEALGKKYGERRQFDQPTWGNIVILHHFRPISRDRYIQQHEMGQVEGLSNQCIIDMGLSRFVWKLAHAIAFLMMTTIGFWVSKAGHGCRANPSTMNWTCEEVHAAYTRVNRWTT